MESQLWGECLNCVNKCCEWKNSFPFPLFVTNKEEQIIKKNGFNSSELINLKTKHPCIFLDKNKLCKIHKIRPIDCKLFPFDIHEINKKFHWILWEFPCKIVKDIESNVKNKEDYLVSFETKVIPKFKKHLGDYSSFRCEELINNYSFVILREVVIKK